MTAQFPTTQGDKDGYFTAARKRLVLNALRLLVAPSNVTALNILFDDPDEGWVKIYAAHISEDGNTTAVQKRVLVLIGLIEAQFTLIYKDIPESVLNTDDFTIFRFYDGTSGHATIEAQKIPATLSIESTHHLGHKIRMKNPLTPASDAMPHGNHVRMKTAVSPTVVDNTLIQWGNNPEMVTHRFYEKSFSDSVIPTQVGQWAAYSACYETTTGKQGDPSPVLWVLIS